MEQLRSGWDLFLLPRTWHKRLNASLLSLIPGIAIVGFFNLLSHPRSIFKDFIINNTAGIGGKIFLFIIAVLVIGFMDVFCFAWPIADLCRFIARRSNKFIIQGFNIVLMKSYAYSHLLFYPVLLIVNPTGLELEKLGQDTSSITQIVIITLYVWAIMQTAIQPGILLRTISIKSKLEFPEKLMVALAIFVWINLVSEAVRYITDLVYNIFASLYGFV